MLNPFRRRPTASQQARVAQERFALQMQVAEAIAALEALRVKISAIGRGAA